MKIFRNNTQLLIMFNRIFNHKQGTRTQGQAGTIPRGPDPVIEAFLQSFKILLNKSMGEEEMEGCAGKKSLKNRNHEGLCFDISINFK
jgi:hypothetical protein